MDVEVPCTEDLANGNYTFVSGLFEARRLMIRGRRLKDGYTSSFGSDLPFTDDEKSQAIYTASMETTPEALTVGIMGHLIERAFFAWARHEGICPTGNPNDGKRGGWKKDMLLQALNEIIMLKIAKDKLSPLAPYFIKSNNEGGLGWLNEERVGAFVRGYKNIKGTN